MTMTSLWVRWEARRHRSTVWHLLGEDRGDRTACGRTPQGKVRVMEDLPASGDICDRCWHRLTA